MKVKDFIENSERFLRSNEIGESRLNSEYIISEVLNVRRPELFLNGDRVLSGPEKRKAGKYLALKARGYPLSWIFGRHDFNGVELSVSPGVFVPRPETEELAETALRASVEKGGRLRVLDFCSGSGCIAVFLALKNPLLSVFAVEKSAKGFSCISRNAAKYGLKNLKAAQGSRIDAFGGRFDFIVSNPPYIPSGVIENLDAEVRMEPRAALDGGCDGLDMVRRIEKKAGKMLAPGGLLFLEFGDGQAEGILGIFRGWKTVSVLKDMGGRERFLKACLHKPLSSRNCGFCSRSEATRDEHSRRETVSRTARSRRPKAAFAAESGFTQQASKAGGPPNGQLHNKRR